MVPTDEWWLHSSMKAHVINYLAKVSFSKWLEIATDAASDVLFASSESVERNN
jgi:hypothetical protein